MLSAYKPAMTELVANIRQVTVYYLDSTSSYLMHKDMVARFVEAQTGLHHAPGINPHNGRPTKRIWKITASSLSFDGPFWWSTPDLQKNFDPAGAPILDGRNHKTLWLDEALVRKWATEEARAEYEADCGANKE